MREDGKGVQKAGEYQRRHRWVTHVDQAAMLNNVKKKHPENFPKESIRQ